MSHLLAIDQGTTSSRAILYDAAFLPVASAQREFRQFFPSPGLVEHDAVEIWNSVVETSREALAKAGVDAAALAGIGITNQRETVVVWDRATGQPIHPAIVWQDRRTAGFLATLEDSGPLIREKTGLLLDPYFSASKLRWILNEVPGALQRAKGGELAAGTVDSWLVYKLTGGGRHVTDPTNASRTMLFNLHSGAWDEELCRLFGIPMAVLPEIVSTSGDWGTTDAGILGAAVPIRSAVGDQQGALFGQLCDQPGMIKCTYGTGCFLLAFTGTAPVPSRHRLLTTVAWRLAGEPLQYALEGSVFMGGAAIQWLRDGLGVISSAPEVNALAASVPDSGGVVLVPAFTGLGAPYWDSNARGALLGMTRGTTRAHIARATLEGIACQVADVVAAMRKDTGFPISTLRVDGGACASDLLMQTQADLLGCDVERPANIESTARGAALLAGLAAGLWQKTGDAAFPIERRFVPQWSEAERSSKIQIWSRAVERAAQWETNT